MSEQCLYIYVHVVLPSQLFLCLIYQFFLHNFLNQAHTHFTQIVFRKMCVPYAILLKLMMQSAEVYCLWF